MKKIILIVIDGMGDRPIKELGNKTPLQFAKTPNMDEMARNGLTGMVTPYLVRGEKTPTSEGAHTAIFGYNDYFLKRGVYEALGVGIKLKKDDIAFRVNLATVDNNLKIIDRRAGRISKTKELLSSLSKIKIKGAQFIMKASSGHRAVLVLRGAFSPEITGNDPKEETFPNKIIALKKEGKETALILNNFLSQAHKILNNHPINKKRKLPANYLLIRGAGKLREIPSFKKRYGLKAICIAGGGLYKGVAASMGMDIAKLKRATADKNTDLKEKISLTLKSIKKYDFVFCHIKAPDNFGHDGDFINKSLFIEKIDKYLKFDREEYLTVITADHSTPCSLKDHSSDDVPLLVFGSKKGNSSSFSEKECKKGLLGRIKQEELLKRITSLE